LSSIYSTRRGWRQTITDDTKAKKDIVINKTLKPNRTTSIAKLLIMVNPPQPAGLKIPLSKNHFSLLLYFLLFSLFFSTKYKKIEPSNTITPEKII